MLIGLFFIPLSVWGQGSDEITNGVELDSGIILLENEESRTEKITEDLQQSINQQNRKIEQLEEEIDSYKKELENVQKERVQIQGEVYEVNVGINKAEAEVKLVQNKILGTQLEIQSLKQSISSKNTNVDKLKLSLGELLKIFNEVNERQQIYIILETGNILASIEALSEINELKREIIVQIKKLTDITQELKNNQIKVILEQTELEELEGELGDRKQLLEVVVTQKNVILDRTQKEEDEQRTILEVAEEERDNLLQEIALYESELNFILDPNSIPKKGNILSLPFEAIVRITQKFGNTSFARISKNYRFHDGVDFGLQRGTKILAAADGEVVGVGNTDIVSSCLLWGKWIAIDHKNGLTTLYAHLDLIRTEIGEKVKRGGLIAYSGNTGYSTGSHLHFSVYATNGFNIVPYEKITGGSKCRGLLVPTTASEAKLNPFDYLSEI